ncbi:MAG: hypothetical protein ACTHQQ_01450 [Solirubrobacteraceae bacterium]
MSESKASRTLLKSPPELWSEVSAATSLQRHMDQFGEIRITKLEPETAVAWEGEHARGTITLEVSGWGTKVSLTAEPVGGNGVDTTEPQAAGVGEPGADVDLVEPEFAGERVEPELAGERVEPELAGERVEPELAGESVDPQGAIAAVAPDRPASPQPDWLDAPRQRPRWTRRMARAFRTWFSPPTQEDGDPITYAADPDPEQPAASSAAVAPEPDRPTTSPALAATTGPTPVVPEPMVQAASPSPAAPPGPPSQQEPPPPLDNAPSAALDAALESLGQAHHRPFSRA